MLFACYRQSHLPSLRKVPKTSMRSWRTVAHRSDGAFPQGATMEIWKSVVGYEGLYEVNRVGVVRSIPRQRPHGLWNAVRSLKGRIIKGWVNADGYKMVALSKDGYVTNKSVHRVVCTAFLPNPFALPCTNHKDGNKHNNAVENLEHCSYSHNNQHAFDLGLKAPSVNQGEKVGTHKLTNEEVLELRSLWQKGYTCTRLAQLYRISRTTAHRVATKRTWTHL